MTEPTVKVSDLASELHHVGVYHLNPYMEWVTPLETPDSYGWGGLHHGAGDEPELAVLMLNVARWGHYDSSATWHRANFEALQRDFPETFLSFGGGSHDGQSLALPMTAEIDEYLAEILRSLEEYPVYDEEKQYEIEAEIEAEDWGTHVEWDLKRQLEEFCDNMRECVSWELLDTMLDSEPEGFLQRLFHDGVRALDAWPVFETADSCYYPNMEGLTAYVAVRLVRHYIDAMVPATAVAGQVALEVAL